MKRIKKNLALRSRRTGAGKKLLTEAVQLSRWRDRRSKYGKKFVVLIFGEHDRQDFRLFSSEKEAMNLFFNAAYVLLTKTPVRDAYDDLVKISGAVIFQVECDDADMAREKIARGSAVRLHDAGDRYAGRELIVRLLFRRVH